MCDSWWVRRGIYADFILRFYCSETAVPSLSSNFKLHLHIITGKTCKVIPGEIWHEIRGGWEQERVAINCEPSKLRMGVQGRGPGNTFWAMPLSLQEKSPFSRKKFLKHVCFCAN